MLVASNKKPRGIRLRVVHIHLNRETLQANLSLAPGIITIIRISFAMDVSRLADTTPLLIRIPDAMLALMSSQRESWLEFLGGHLNWVLIAAILCVGGVYGFLRPGRRRPSRKNAEVRRCRDPFASQTRRPSNTDRSSLASRSRARSHRPRRRRRPHPHDPRHLRLSTDLPQIPRSDRPSRVDPDRPGSFVIAQQTPSSAARSPDHRPALIQRLHHQLPLPAIPCSAAIVYLTLGSSTGARH